MYANLALLADLLRYSKGIIDRKLNENIYFLSAMLVKKIMLFMETRIAQKSIMVFALVFLDIFSITYIYL